MAEPIATPTLFETERLYLKATNLDDDALILELLNSPKWLKYIGDRKVTSLDAAQSYIKERILPQQKRLGFGSFTILRKKDHQKIGTCGLFDRDGLEGIDIGYALLPEYEGKGYAFEAVSRLRDMAFTIFGLDDIHAITLDENAGSKGLLGKLGFKEQGTVTLPDDDAILLLYSLRKEEEDSSHRSK